MRRHACHGDVLGRGMSMSREWAHLGRSKYLDWSDSQIQAALMKLQVSVIVILVEVEDGPNVEIRRLLLP